MKLLIAIIIGLTLYLYLDSRTAKKAQRIMMSMEFPEPGPHLDQALRQTRQHHVELSAMADAKANMLITLASLVIAFSTATIIYISDREPLIHLPLVTLIFFCFGTIFTAAYASMPKVDLQKKPNVNSPEFNPLFFGSFMNLSYEEYQAVMAQWLNNPQSTYELQVREIYYLGVFLGRQKYQYIRYSYQIFILGLILSASVLFLTELSLLTS